MVSSNHSSQILSNKIYTLKQCRFHAIVPLPFGTCPLLLTLLLYHNFGKMSRCNFAQSFCRKITETIQIAQKRLAAPAGEPSKGKALAYLRGQARVTLYLTPLREKVNSRSSFTTLRSAMPRVSSPFIIAVHI